MRAIDILSSILASTARGWRGTRAARHSQQPDTMLELYSFESSPFSRLVRETLGELEIAYVLSNMGKAVNANMGPPWVREKFFADTPVEGRNRKRMKAETGSSAGALSHRPEHRYTHVRIGRYRALSAYYLRLKDGRPES